MLHWAIGLRKTYVQLLLSGGADVDARNDQQQSILDSALDTSNRMIDLLVENGVDSEARDSEGRTALLKAVQKQYGADRVKTLIRHGADIHAKDTGGQTVLHHLCGLTDGVLQQFLQLGVDVNAKDANGATPLDFAVRQTDNVKIDLLLNFGGIPGNNSSTGRTVLHDLHRSTDSILRVFWILD